MLMHILLTWKMTFFRILMLNLKLFVIPMILVIVMLIKMLIIIIKTFINESAY